MQRAKFGPDPLKIDWLRGTKNWQTDSALYIKDVWKWGTLNI